MRMRRSDSEKKPSNRNDQRSRGEEEEEEGLEAAAAAGEAPFVEDERFWLRDAGTPEDSGTAARLTPEPGSAMQCMGACGIKGARISYVAIVSFRFDCLRHVSFGLASVL